jgi:hypothetical protein
MNQQQQNKWRRQAASGALGRGDGRPSRVPLRAKWPRLIGWPACVVEREWIAGTDELQLALVPVGGIARLEQWIRDHGGDGKEGKRWRKSVFVAPRQLHLPRKLGMLEVVEVSARAEEIETTTIRDICRTYRPGRISYEIVVRLAVGGG